MKFQNIFLTFVILLPFTPLFANVSDLTTSTGASCGSSFSYEIDSLDNMTFSFIDESQGEVIEWFWEFGNGDTSSQQNPTYTYPTTGQYVPALTITTTDGCSNYYCLFVFAGDGTSADCPVWFYANNTGQYNYQFYSGHISGASLDNVTWDFDDGVTSNYSSPSHAFSVDGFHNVTMTAVIDNDTCSVSLPIDVYFNNTPVCYASFTPYNNNWQEPHIMSFQDYSQGTTPIVSWEWDFGNGDTSNEQEPIYTYTEIGTYIITLTITAENGCYNSSEETIIIESLGCDCGTEIDSVCVQINENFFLEYLNPCLAGCDGFTEFVDCSLIPPIECEASFFWDVNPSNLSAHFIDVSSASGDIIEWLWDFGDGHISTQKNPNHIYSSDDQYEVSLTITTDEDCESTYSTLIDFDDGIVNGNQISTFFWFNQNQNNLMEFSFVDQTLGEVDTWSWNFGDNNSSTEQTPTHEYQSAGNYLVTLETTNSIDSVSSEYSIVVNVGNDIWYNNQCQSLFIPVIQENNHVAFLDMTWGNAVDYYWEFGEGATSNQPFTVQHTYPTHGIYEIKLTTTTTDGCTSEFSTRINLINKVIVGKGNTAAIILSNNHELPAFQSFIITPNPLQNELNINIDNVSSADATITMTNQLGQNLMTQKAKLLAGANQINLATASLATGMYYLTIQTETHRETKMVVKQ